MQKRFKSILVAVLGCTSFLFASCEFPIKANYEVNLNVTSLSIGKGDQKSVKITSVTRNGLPLNNYSYTWTSNDSNIATIDNAGRIYGVEVGTTKVVTSVVIPNVSTPVKAECSVSIFDRLVIEPSDIVLNIETAKSATLKAKFDGVETNSVSWKSSNPTVVSVVKSSGLLTAKNTGEAIITATYSNDTRYSAECNVKVTSDSGIITGIELTPKTSTLDCSVSETVQLKAIVSGEGPFDDSVTWSSSDNKIASVSNRGLVTAISKGNATITATSKNDTIFDTAEIIVTDSIPVSVSLDKTNVEISQGRKLRLNATVLHAADKSVTWSSSNANVSVTDGLVFVNEDVPIGTIVTITATSNEDNTKKATCVLKVIEKSLYDYDYTIMFYMCASTLESESGRSYPGLFSDDIKEILKVDLPETVRVIIETGGTKKWSLNSSYIDGAASISQYNLQRWEVVNHKIKLIDTLDTNYMASEESYESFLKWGLEDYGAEQMGVVISGHGGGLRGCAYDDNYYDNCLNTIEIVEATKNALESVARSKLTWMGFDCCLMGSADIASALSDYFDYMIGSQESELGQGWDHDIYMKKIVEDTNVSPEILLPEIARSFVDYGHSTFCSSYEKCLQTLSVVDLTKMDTFVDEFNSYIHELGVNRSAYSKYKTAFDDSYNSFGEGYYGCVDLKDFINNLHTQFVDVSTEKVLSALDDMMLANYYCSRYSTIPCGLNAFFPETVRGERLQVAKSDYSGSEVTKFTEYQEMCLNNGDWARY